MIYINFDLETTGFAPDRCGILSIGAVAQTVRPATHEIEFMGEFSAVLELPISRSWDPDTEDWWSKEENMAAFALATKNPQPVYLSLLRFYQWIKATAIQEATLQNYPLKGSVSLVANPLSFDLPILCSYIRSYIPRWDSMNEDLDLDLLGGVDLPTLAMAANRVQRNNSGRRKWPKDWSEKNDVPHSAIHDARFQSRAFASMMRVLKMV